MKIIYLGGKCTLNKKNKLDPLVIIASLIVVSYITSNIMAVKLINLHGLTFFDAGTVVFPLAYMFSDVLTEIWGFKIARKVIFLTFFCNLFLVAFTIIGILLPAPEYMNEINEAYKKIFTVVPRILIASLAAFLVGELANSFVLQKVKELTNSKHLWIRTISSSAVGYLFDTIIFVVIAFGNTAPIKDLITMMCAQYIMKIGLESLCGTPLAYALVGYIRRREARQ